MLLCDIASLSRLSITIVSLTGFSTPQKQPQHFVGSHIYGIALYHSDPQRTGKRCRPAGTHAMLALVQFSVQA